MSKNPRLQVPCSSENTTTYKIDRLDMASGADNIPHELLANIGNRLNTKTDVSRFRAVSKSWRSSIPPFKNLLQLPSEVWFAVGEDGIDSYCVGFTLVESAVYHIAPPTDDDPRKRGWLINVKEVGTDQLSEQPTHRMLHPLSRLFGGQPKSLPKVFNLMEFRVFEVAKMYSLVYDHEMPDDHLKVAASLNLDFPAVMAIDPFGTLYYGELGGDVVECINFPLKLDDLYPGFQDVIFYKGRFCAVCRDGRSVGVDSCLNTELIASPLANSSCHDDKRKKKLVESLGELLLVDMYLYGKPSDFTFEIFKLDAHKKQWAKLEAQALDDRILVLGDDGCYSLSARDFPGVEGRCIYFKEASYKCNELENMSGEIAVYSLDSGRVSQITDFPGLNIFCPPTTWRWHIMNKAARKRKMS
ncbi:F-box protein At2g17036-like [Malus sylvestris]|uniref:F-box protein At2g17036-like n=1 Tax=Malus sylvestris TaxID=3752 RepID=UPI0021AC443D|nr:F-box protein At2g17036-like [Malus sylvestris]